MRNSKATVWHLAGKKSWVTRRKRQKQKKQMNFQSVDSPVSDIKQLVQLVANADRLSRRGVADLDQAQRNHEVSLLIKERKLFSKYLRLWSWMKPHEVLGKLFLQGVLHAQR
jgi:hypothetical protein